MRVRNRSWFWLALVFAAILAGRVCYGGEDPTGETMTPLLLSVRDPPIAFTGSDGRVHLVYELWMTNFSSGELRVDRVEVRGDGIVLERLESPRLAARLQPAGLRDGSATLARSAQALLFLHVTLAAGAPIPRGLSHRLSIWAAAAPPGHQDFTETGGTVDVDRQKVPVIGPPLRGDRYISADSCCDATRHTRAALPVNGRVWVAQRYAVDWEQLDAGGRIYSGTREALKSYTIFGQPALAVADAVVSSTTEGQPEQTPGKYPVGISLDAADGNSVVLKLDERMYALYAHLQPGSITVRSGDHVKRGQVLGLVGNTGNSVAPHLHFQLMDGPLSLAANGLPYEIDSFEVTGRTPGTEAFDEAEEKGVPLAVSPVSPALTVKGGLPLDQLVISFGPPPLSRVGDISFCGFPENPLVFNSCYSRPRLVVSKESQGG